MSKFYLKISEEISFIRKKIIFNDAVIIDLWYFYDEQNKSRWEGGQKKIKKRYQYFFKKRVFKGGGQKKFMRAYPRKLCPP